MRIFLYTIITAALFILSSCAEIGTKKMREEGKINGNIYSSDEIGWTMEIPSGWNIIDLEQTKKTNQVGLKALEETLNSDVDISQLKQLLALKKNSFNIFQSSSEPFNLEYEGEYEENNGTLKKIMYETYQNQGIKADTSSTTIENIDGYNFLTYSFTLYGRKNEIILTQILYSRLINGFDFGAFINYNNENDKNELLKAFRSSKFRKN